MRQKPWPIIVLAFFHALSPVGNSIFNALKYKINFWELWQFWWEQLPYYLLFSYFIVPIIAGLFIYLCKRWSFYAYLFCILLLVISSIIGLRTDLSFMNISMFILFLVIDVLLVAYFMAPSVKSIYLDPKLRWWEAAPRYAVELDVEFNESDFGQVSNVSVGGMFLRTETFLPDNQIVTFNWNYLGIEYLVEGQIVHHQLSGTHGYGVKFAHTLQSEKSIKSFVEQLASEGRLIHNRSAYPEKTFLNWLRDIFVLRKGFFPEVRSGK